MKATVVMLSYQWETLAGVLEQSLGLKLAMVDRPTARDATWKVTSVGLYVIVCSVLLKIFVLHGKFPNFPFPFFLLHFGFPFFRFPSIRFPIILVGYIRISDRSTQGIVG